jgi:hypothetical protein
VAITRLLFEGLLRFPPWETVTDCFPALVDWYLGDTKNTKDGTIKAEFEESRLRKKDQIFPGYLRRVQTDHALIEHYTDYMKTRTECKIDPAGCFSIPVELRWFGCQKIDKIKEVVESPN